MTQLSKLFSLNKAIRALGEKAVALNTRLREKLAEYREKQHTPTKHGLDANKEYQALIDRIKEKAKNKLN